MALDRAAWILSALLVAPASLLLVLTRQGDMQAYGLLGLAIAAAILVSCWAARPALRPARRPKAIARQSREIWAIRNEHFAQ